MVSRTARFSIAAVLIGLLAVAGLFASGSFSVVGQEVLLPQFARAECEAGPQAFFPCGEGNTCSTSNGRDMSTMEVQFDEDFGATGNVWAVKPTRDKLNAPSYTVEMKSKEQPALGIAELPTTITLFKREEGESSFTEVKSWQAEDENQWIERGSFDINTEVKIVARDQIVGVSAGNEGMEEDELRVRFKYQRYDLKVTQGTNFGRTVKNSCELTEISSLGGETVLKKDANKTDLTTGGHLPFGAVVNYVESSTPNIDNGNVVDWDDDGTLDRYFFDLAENGVRYYPIVEGENGQLYADSRNAQIETEAVCLPADLLCGEKGTQLQNPEDASCSELSGAFADEKTFFQDQICTPQCTDGSVELTNCQAVPDCGENEFLTSDYQCQKLEDITSEGEQKPAGLPIWAWALIGATAVGFVLFLILALDNSGNGSKGGKKKNKRATNININLGGKKKKGGK